MNQLPMETLTPGQRQRLASQLYTLLGDQVISYHRHYHMGSNSSVPTEIARELTDSIWYTVGMVDLSEPDLPALLKHGQAILSEKLEQARALFRLVSATAPEEASQFHWEALHTLSRYLDTYDHLHFAHRVPQELYYPLLVPVPEHLQGIDYALFYLNCLWLEHQILASFPAGSISRLYGSLPPDYWEAPQNLCEQLLWNALAKILLDRPLDSFCLDTDEADHLYKLLHGDLHSLFGSASFRLSQVLGWTENMTAYASGAIRELLPRLTAALPSGDLSQLFVTA